MADQASTITVAGSASSAAALNAPSAVSSPSSTKNAVTVTGNTTSSTVEDELLLAPSKAKYRVETFSLIIPGAKDPVNLVPASINKITIVQDFENCIQPILKVETILPPLIVDYISTHKGEIYFNLRLVVEVFNTAERNYRPNDVGYSKGIKDLCNGKFILFTSESSRIPNIETYKLASEQLSGANATTQQINGIQKCGANLVNYTKEYGMFLWKADDLYNLRKPVNAVYSSCTVGDAASGILSDNGFNNVLMAPPDNTTDIDQLVIPPMNLLNVFSFLQTQYGMYSTDVFIFCDIYRMYVLDKSGESKAVADGEYPKMIFDVVRTYSEKAMATGTSSLDKKKEYHNMVDIEDLELHSLSNISDVIDGNNSMYVDSRNNEVTTVSGSGEQRGDGCTKISTDQEGTAYTKKRWANQVNELKMQLKITHLPDYDYTAVTPNKTFIFAFKEKDYYVFDGYYRLLNARHFLIRQGTEMAIVGEFNFTRKKGLTEDEKNEIEYDVFKTAQVTDEGKEKAKATNTDSAKACKQYDEKVATAKEKVTKCESEVSLARTNRIEKEATYSSAVDKYDSVQADYKNGTATEEDVANAKDEVDAADKDVTKAKAVETSKQTNLENARNDVIKTRGEEYDNIVKNTPNATVTAPVPVSEAPSDTAKDLFKVEPFKPSTDTAYQAQEAKAAAATAAATKTTGSPAPTPLSEKHAEATSVSDSSFSKVFNLTTKY